MVPGHSKGVDMLKRILFVGLILLVLAGCESTPPPTPVPPEPAEPTASPTPAAPPESPSTGLEVTEGRILISELMLGAGGNRDFEFVELYNAGTTPVDLMGWSLWYRLNESQDEKLVFAWQATSHVPGLGHLLLVREGEEIGLTGDGQFDVPLFEGKGGLVLRDASDQVVDALGWEDPPANYFATTPAPAPGPDASLERKPGDSAGNGVDTGDNAADFIVNSSPNPQNSGSDITPLPEGRLVLQVDLPNETTPGAVLEVVVTLENLTGAAATDILLSLPIPEGFEVQDAPAGAEQVDGALTWTVDELADGETREIVLSLRSPWTYLNTAVTGAYAEAADWPLRAYGPPNTLAVAGGSIPIATARTLEGKTLTIEGIATMYTDAFYAGSTGTKFYIEDESGGIQVYCPGGLGLVEAGLGDRVRVTGEIEIYRSSVEIIPGTYPDDIEILAYAEQEWPATPITLQQASSDETIPGRLVDIEGIVTRIDEYSYSYEVDLTDESGFTQLLYIEKETGISIEPLEIGQIYRVLGISELYDADWQVKPRLQSDFTQVFPPELMLEIRAQNSALPGDPIAYQLTAYNHTADPLTNLVIVAPLPSSGTSVADIGDPGQLDEQSNVVTWTIPELPPDGASVTVNYTLLVEGEIGDRIMAPSARATADQWTEAVTTTSLLTFVGHGVPIWAIQGARAQSPYVRSTAATQGVVTGVFPELGGFWIQELETDQDPATSAGILILVEPGIETEVQPGDWVRLSGKVRESSGQTMLHLLAATDLELVSSGNPTPEPVELDPPLDAAASAIYYEALEGMLVQVTARAVAVAPTTKYGETVLVLAEWGIDRIMHGEPTGLMIVIDDGSSTTHYDSSTLPFAIKSGDSVSNVVGPLAFTFDMFKIEPIAMPDIIPAERPLPLFQPVGGQAFSVATFNVENLFDFQAPHPSDPPLPSLREYKLKLAKTADAIIAMGAPTIIGLQEVENIGVLEDLVEQEAILQFGYQPVLIEGFDSRGIDVGYLVRSDQAVLEGAGSYPAPEGLTSRPPLLITVTVQLDEPVTVYLLNNHFTSMSGGELPTEPRRNAQALWNVSLVERITAQDPDAFVVVMGDLNSYYDSLPIDSLRGGGLNHVYEFVEPARPYSYIYQGESETLDHLLVTPALYQHISDVRAVHIDADYPPADPEDASPRRVSDHDPIVVILSFE